jgi:hypothetical protein
MRLKTPGDLVARITNAGDSCFLPMQEGGKQLAPQEEGEGKM